jgi:hypothetical protein
MGRIVLFRGFGDSRHEVEWFSQDNAELDWICPESVNGYWYGFESEE